MDFFKRKSIASQLSLVVSLSVIVMFILIGISFYTNVNNMLMEHIKRETLLQAENVSKDINYIFKDAKLSTQQLANNRQVKAYLKGTTNRQEILTNPLYKDVIFTLKDVKECSDLYNYAWAGNEKVSFYINSNEYITDAEYSVKDRPWYKIAMNTLGVTFTSPYIDYASNKIIFTSIAAVHDGDEVIGFVGIDIFLDSLPEIFKGTKIGEKGKNFLITDDGTYVYRDDKNIYTMENIYSANDELKNIADKIVEGEGNFDEITYQGDVYYIVSCPVKETGWVVISLVNKNETTQDLLIFTLIISILFVLILTALIITIIMIINKKTKPLSIITKYAEEIAAGDLNKNLPDNYLKRPDETGDLSRAFQIITEAFRKENDILESRIEEKNKELEEQYKYILQTEKMASLGNIVAGVAHDINTPLGVAITTASYLDKINSESRQKLSQGNMSKNDLMKFMEEVDDSIGITSLNLNRAAELIKNFKKVAVDQTSENKTEFLLKENIESVIFSLKHEYAPKHKIYNLCPEDIILNSYPGAFSQIFTNFIMNSLIHGFKNAENGTMEISAQLENNMLTITYKDDGIGISEENLKNIFEPFFTTNRQGGCSGLGLHIVHNIITQKLKGHIRCESKMNQGVKFIIEIPV